jgi:hypothetical protein
MLEDRIEYGHASGIRFVHPLLSAIQMIPAACRRRQLLIVGWIS